MNAVPPPPPPDDEALDPLLAGLRQRLGDYGQAPPPGAWAAIRQRVSPPPPPPPWWRRRQLLAVLGLLLGCLLLPGKLGEWAGQRWAGRLFISDNQRAASHSLSRLSTASVSGSQPPRAATAAPATGEITPQSAGQRSSASALPMVASVAATRPLAAKTTSAPVAAQPVTSLRDGRKQAVITGNARAYSAAALAVVAGRRHAGHRAPGAIAAVGEGRRARARRLGRWAPVRLAESAGFTESNTRAEQSGTRSAVAARPAYRSRTAEVAHWRPTSQLGAAAESGRLVEARTLTARQRAHRASRVPGNSIIRASLVDSAAAKAPAAAGAIAPLLPGFLAPAEPLDLLAISLPGLPLLAALPLATLVARPDSTPPSVPVRRWALLVLAGPMVSYRTLGPAPTLGLNRPDFARLERPALGLGAQVQVRRVLSGRWALAVGLGYHEYATRLALSLKDSAYTSIHQRDTYRLLTVPVQFGYALGAPESRLSKALLIGFEPGWYLGGRSTEGSGCGCEQQAYSSAGSPYRSLSVALSLGLDLRYRLGGASTRWQWLVQPTGHYVATPFVRADAVGFTQRQPFSLGLLTGFSWDVR